MKLNTLFLAAAITLALAACNKPAESNSPMADAAAPTAPTTDAPAATPAPAAADAMAPAATDAMAPAAAPAVASIGVPECDDYLTKVNACLTDKVPEAQRGAFQSSLDQTRSAWAQAASTPQGKTAIAAACKSALEQSKAQYAAFGCSM